MTVLGLDIGGTTLKAARVRADGSIERSASRPTPPSREAFASCCAELVLELTAQAPPVAGIGIGCRGLIETSTTFVASLPGACTYLEGAHLRDFVAPLLPEGARIAADNDARAALAGEVAFGAARGLRDALLFTLGTGLGGAILSDGRIVRGARGVAGHLGHVTVHPDGPLCICGNRGCLETYFSARAIEAEVHAGLHRGVDTSLHPGATCQEIFAASVAGDPLARIVVERATQALAAGIAGLLHAFDPEAVILGGAIARAGDVVFEPVRAAIRTRTRRLLRREVPVLASAFADGSGVLGCAALVLADALAGPCNAFPLMGT